VAAYVASNMADVAFGVETPARRFDLDFVPMHSERYFLLCQARRLGDAVLQQTLRTLCGQEFRSAVDQLPGYQADNAGRVFELGEAFPGLWAAAARSRRPRAKAS
jgi:molybdate-binding protein